MGQGGSCNLIPKLQKGVDGLHRNSAVEVVVSKPTLLTSEHVLPGPPQMKQSSGFVLPLSPQRKHSLPSQTPLEFRCPTDPTLTPPSRGQRSPEYKYNMTQLLQMAEEERMRKQMQPPGAENERFHHRTPPSEPLAQTQHIQPLAPQSIVQEPHAMSKQMQPPHQLQSREQAPQGHSLQQYQLHEMAPTQQNAPTEPMATLPQLSSYQTSSSSRFQQIPNTVPLAAGVDRLDPVIVQQLLRNRKCILVDVRGDDRSAGTIEGAVHVPAVDAVPFAIRVQECVRQWSNQPLVIFHCQYSAHRAPQCANWYREQAPENQRVAIMDGGFRAWESLGLPVQQGIQGLGGQQHSNMYALQQGMQFAFSAQQLARAN